MTLWALAGPAIGLWGANQQKKAMARMAGQLQEAGIGEANAIESAVRPMNETLGWSLPMLKQAGINLFGSKVGKDSPIIRGQFEEAKKGVEAEKQSALASSRQTWLASGNTGRGRGEELRIGAQATEAMNKLSLGAGEAQEAYRDQNARNYTGWLGGMVDFGKQGISGLIDAARARFGGMRDAAGVKAQGSNMFTSGVTGLAGDAWGASQDNDQRKWLEKMYSLFGKK